MMHIPSPRPISRRDALCKMGAGFGMMSFASVVAETLANAAESPSAAPWMIQDPKFKPKAKHVIFLFMNGGLSQVDSFDPKPMLEKYNGQPLPGETPQHERKTGGLMKSPFSFKKYGKSGIEVSEIFPNIGECIDDICVIRSVHTEIPNHEPALIMMNTGANVAGRPSMGSWLTYGLGTENKNLPSFVVLCPDVPTTVGPPLWNSAFLPPMYQGTYVTDDAKSKDFDPQTLIPNIHNETFDLTRQKKELDLIAELDRLNMGPSAHDPQLEATISALETAYRMQTEAPDVFDVRKETEAVQKLYGEGSTARGCLTAARLVVRGVRMVQLYYAKGDPWDHHFDIQLHRKTAHDSDQPFAALVKDLKARGLFDETLIVCGSEFGRTPVVNLGGFQSIHNGRDHNHYGFSVLLAGGGVKSGLIYGATDEFGFKATESPVHVHDLHATCLHLLGLDHEKLTYRYSGRDFRLTDVEGHVVKDILA